MLCCGQLYTKGVFLSYTLFSIYTHFLVILFLSFIFFHSLIFFLFQIIISTFLLQKSISKFPLFFFCVRYFFQFEFFAFFWQFFFFFGRYFIGQVVTYQGGTSGLLFHVVYDDCDEEDLTLAELSPLRYEPNRKRSGTSRGGADELSALSPEA